jgi:prephenate dehydrogenase
MARSNRSPEPLLLLGYGQFGRALAELCLEADLETWAEDPVETIPSRLRSYAPDPVEAAGTVVVSVPVLGFRAALEGIADRLTPEHLVIDVSSVRTAPEATMRQLLGGRIPWVGTHPLFGPTSIARGERPLQVVVCPNPEHPTAAGQAEALFQALGCQVQREEAEDHDRRMAYTHALAFYLAQALLDVGVPTESQAVPPSFRSVTRMMEAVRSDAGHLNLAIQRLNPFATDARRDLLDALSRLHDELENFDPTSAETGPGPEAFRIPDLGDATPALMETRDLIDEVDRELVRVIGRRIQLARRAGRIKRSRGVAIRDPERERALLRLRKAWAEAEGLDPTRVQRLFEGLIALARSAQEDG